MIDNISRLSWCIRDTLHVCQEVAEKKEGRAQRGIYTGGSVVIGGQTYPAAVATYIPLEDGCAVWAQLSSGGKAVVIGV